MNESPTSRIAATVRAEVARNRVGQAQIAERLGLSQPAVSRRLSGVVAFTATELVAVADLLGVSAAYLLGEEQRTDMAAVT